MSCRQALLDLLWDTVYTYSLADRAVMYGKPGFYGYSGVNQDPLTKCFLGKVRGMILAQHAEVMASSIGVKASNRVRRGDINALQVFANFVGIMDLPDKLNVSSLDRLVKLKYRGAPEKLLVDIQYLHDRPEHWTKQGVSKDGMRYAKNVHEKWLESPVWENEPPYVHKPRRRRRSKASTSTPAEKTPSARSRRKSHMYGAYAAGRIVLSNYGPRPIGVRKW